MAGRTPTPVPPAAYSYQRFSSRTQGAGDSVRRQTALRDAWLSRSGAALDTTLSLRDEGLSAFTGSHRENPDRSALAAFLELVRQKRIARGSYLIVESLDRLTREHIRPALTLLLNLIDAGIRVVQLLPAEQVFDENVEPMQLMMAVMELSRGHSESRMKSERVGAAWRNLKAKAAREKVPITRAVPSWLRVAGGKFEVIEVKAAAVRRVFALATEGFGIDAILCKLNREKVPAIGRGKHWSKVYVAKLLSYRAVLGEYQPCRGSRTADRKPDGPPIPDYFPRVVTEAQWLAARAAVESRRRARGRAGRRVNVFKGLLRDARDGASLVVCYKGKRGRGPALVNYNATRGVPGACYVGFSLATFEAAALSRLREIDPRSVLPPDPAGDDVLTRAGKLADIEGRLTKIKAHLVTGDGDIPALVDAIRALEVERVAAAESLAEARRRAASPLSEAWGAAKSLAESLDSSPDPTDARTRLRAAVRRIVSGLWCLFVASGRDRLAAVRVQFEGDAHRDYLILHRGGHGNRHRKVAPTWAVRSFPAGAGGFDLRDPKQAAKLERVLSSPRVAAELLDFRPS